MKYGWIGSIIVGCVITLVVGIAMVEKFNDKNNDYFVTGIETQINFFYRATIIKNSRKIFIDS